MKLGTTLDVATREAWRQWLERNFDKEKEIWLVYHRKASGKARIPYDDAVEEALCFGWIDSTVKKIDDDSFAQRFTPRSLGTPVSEPNKERIRRLIAAGRMMPVGLAAAGDISSKLEIAPDILAALQQDKRTWANFEGFPESYRIIRVAYVEGARRRPAEFSRRLNNLLRMTAQGKMFGMMR
jgi:uncharacterized protein YdeI (YjbR/CyaY-like superfamily)